MPPVTTTLAAELDRHLKQQRSKLQEIQAKLATSTNNIRVVDADMRLWVSRNFISTALAVINQLLSASKTVHLQTSSEEGYLKEQGGGILGCGYYAELQDRNKLAANLELKSVRPFWAQNNDLNFDADFGFNFSGQVHGVARGAAGLCVEQVEKKVFGKTIKVPTGKTWMSCDCPVGGGIGSSAGLSGEKGGTLSGRVTLSSDQNDWLHYELALTGPPELAVTVSVGLEKIGSLGIPITFPVPARVLSVGTAPPLFAETGVVVIPGLNATKKYEIKVSPKPLVVDDTGYATKASAILHWF